jgi:prepilin-type N-terminal cleavage/methylation domain-containing protein
MKKHKGLTLIELLLVISIITVLTAVILIAIDPATRLAEARNAARSQEVTSLLNSVLEYVLDNNGTVPGGIDNAAGTVQVIGTNVGDCGALTCSTQTVAATSCQVDLSTALVDEYLAEVPTDPQNGDASDTRYYINKTAGGRIVVGSCSAELGETIEVQR